MEIESFEQNQVNIGSWFGIESSFLTISLGTIFNTWFILLLLILILLLFRFSLERKKSTLAYILLSATESFMELISQTLGKFIYKHFAFITSLFIFILFCNCIAVIPWTTEPTTDLNTTLALGLVSFFYKEYYAIKTQGLWGYFQEFLRPFFLMLPVNIIGHFSKIISISFRLFGNIFGGSIIMELYRHAIAGSLLLELLGLFSGLNFLILIFFGLFEGIIQAFVFSMLSLTYLALALQEDEPEA
jgi:F-type H+-transporting ATPase subunit a